MKSSLSSLVLAAGISLGTLGCGESEWKACTYNIHGIPDYYSELTPSENVPRISEIINEINEDEENKIDLLIIQENFATSYKFLMNTNYPYRYPVPPICEDAGYSGEEEGDWDECVKILEQDENHWQANTPNGLVMLSFFPMKAYHGWKWDDCYGLLDNGGDCAAPKGFTVVEVEVSPGTWIDVYDLHADSGDTEEDQLARDSQFEQFSYEFNQRTQNKAAIIGGDFNESKYHSLEQIWNRAGLQDLCNSTLEGEDGEPIETSCPEGTIDRMMFRNGYVVKLKPLDFYVLDEFYGDQGEPLSDHQMICADFISYKSIP